MLRQITIRERIAAHRRRSRTRPRARDHQAIEGRPRDAVTTPTLGERDPQLLGAIAMLNTSGTITVPSGYSATFERCSAL